MNTLTQVLIRLILFIAGLSAALFLFALPTAGSGPTQARITQVDASRFPEVTAYVSVIDAAGNPIGVDPNRITLNENGKPVKIESARPISAGNPNDQVQSVTTLLVMDISGSMAEAGKLDAAKTAARAYVNQLRQNDKIGLLTFNTQFDYVVPITADRQAILSAIGNLTAGGNTAMYDALMQGVTKLNSVAGRKAIIVLTDGLDNSSKSKADNVIQQIGPAGVTISAIGLGEPSQGTASMAGIDEAGLKSLAGRAGGLYAYVNDATGLRQVFERLGLALQNEYALTFHSSSTLRDGLNRTLQVTLVDPAGANISAEGKYNPGGLVPEVAQTNPLPVFVAGLALLLALLLLPGLLTRAGTAMRTPFGKPRAARIRIQTARAVGNGSIIQRAGGRINALFGGIGKQRKAARGRVRLK